MLVYVEVLLEIVLNMLAEATTTELTRAGNPEGLEENKQIARAGGKVAGDARRSIESQTGQPVISSKNATALNTVVTKTIEGVVQDTEEKEKK